MAQRKISIEGMKGPHRVKPGKSLMWPKWLYAPRLGIPRGLAGYVVDLDLPYEAVLCANQAQVLEPAPGEQPSPIEHKPALLWLRKNGHISASDGIGRIRIGQAMKERAEQAKTRESDLPGLDQPPGHQRATRPSKTKKEDGDAVAGKTSTSGS